MDFSVYAAGLTMGLSLIVAIGAQNAFVLRQGLKKQHVFAVCLTCGQVSTTAAGLVHAAETFLRRSA